MLPLKEFHDCGYVVAIESERRGLGIRAARRLAEVLDIPVGRIIDPKNDW